MGGQNRRAPRCSVRKQARKSSFNACRKSKSQVSAEGEDCSVYAALAEGLGSPEAAEGSIWQIYQVVRTKCAART
jgi:hypothetical protein